MQKSVMMKNLTDVISKVMSEMYFIFISDEEPYDSGSNKDDYIYTLVLENEEQLLLEFKLNKRLMDMMLLNLIGMELDELDDQEIINGIKEFVNVVGGNFINMFEKKMDMKLPKIMDKDYNPEQDGYKIVDETELWFDNQIMNVRILEK